MPVDDADILNRLDTLGLAIQDADRKVHALRNFRAILLSISQEKNDDGSNRAIIDTDTGDPIIPARRQKVYDSVKGRMDTFLS